MPGNFGSRRDISRKDFLALGAALAGASLLPGCSAFSMDPDTADRSKSGGKAGAGAGAAGKGKESPMLAARVKAGSLPPVEKRLPANPRVIQPLERLGVYGGTWRTVEASTDPSWLWMTVCHDHLISWDPTWTKIIPNVAESYEIRGNGREYVFKLREGMRWSDGQPFTADDLLFWYEKIYLNKEITPVLPSTLQINGKPLVVEKQDDQTVTFRFPEPNAVFLQNLAIHGPPFRLLPRHYLERFHKDFNPELGNDWAQKFLEKIDELNNVDLPVVTGWVPKNPHGDGDRQVWERNPYYFKVDPDGSQLPYIDKVVFTFFQEQGPLILQAANGDVDLYMRAEVTTPKNRPVLARGTRTGGYKLVKVKDPTHNTVGICLNLTHEDPDKRRMFQNKDFRIGLSHAINRPQIIDLVFLGQGVPWQTAPRPEVPFYKSDDMGKQYTEYNLELAKRYLDKAGYARTDARGRRLGADGRPIVISVLIQSRYPVMIDAMEFVKGTWAKVGIELRIDTASPELVGTRMDANKYDCTLDVGELGYKGMLTDPRWFFATGGSSYAPLWSRWYEGGTPQEKPPEAMRRQAAIYRQKVVGSSDVDTQYAGMREIIEIARDEFWTMGISRPAESYAIVSDRIHNVPGDNKMWLAFKCPYPAVTNISQYYLEGE
ncbi:ABC transporter substrate-binding protein [Actinopolymorpha singaporensis]|uniref:Peptide/nickel transport system substrate-binding protein n=1 Tax=Actinopolymorpha singaporensis TaxID=117157 RepID=A0A1H1R5B3_9ACTN|nr:ABC transporter substrate-binding protein [Actinopolymorpha singaporensis]SDS30785.1 peptide/nickel transport system substrate-binding protein [Actinopolymorpha singaporensis]